MSITIELTYDMAREFGQRKIELPSARTVSDAVRLMRLRFPGDSTAFLNLTRVTAIAVNGVLIRYHKGMKTRLHNGDTLSFVKAAAGG
ncbi:MoaD/ThiS family protein [Myxococcota bacterium]|nr:MoaD/ThiS family protein [Myxococcota bacterium]